MVNSEYIMYLLATNNAAVERAMIVLYNRQTFDEIESKQTKHLNGRGFSACDAKLGTYLAQYIKSDRHLTGKWLNAARLMSFKYVGQLLEEAEIKASRKYNIVEERRDILARIDREITQEQGDMA